MRWLLVPALALASASCAQDVTAVEVFNLDRPSAVAFGCWGDLRVTNGAEQTAEQPIISTAMPPSVCKAFSAYAIRDEAGNQNPDLLPEGQKPISMEPSPQFHAYVSFVLQPTKGSVALIEQATDGLSAGSVGDPDPFTPGRNAIPIGTLPVDLATSADNCFVVSANAGSCDLSTLDIDSAVDRDVRAKVVHVQPRNATGEAVLAKPAAIVAEPTRDDVGYECPDQPQGVVYVAYPDCNLVAAIDVTSGEVVAGIRFGDGTVEITDGNVTCNDQCGDGAMTSRITIGGPGRPVALDLDGDGYRLYIGAENLPTVTFVDLDTAFLPVNVQQVDVYGEVGVRRLAVSPVINMGGTTGDLSAGSAGDHQFVYAITSDDTIRVVEVKNKLTECDTQVDPRYLHDVTDVGFLACMPVGDVNTPPRRSNRRSPGIHLPGTPLIDFDGVPLDVSFAAINGSGVTCDVGSYCGERMVGYFALVSSADGAVYVVNVDDDVYRDFENASSPSDVWVPLAIAHQLRDLPRERDKLDLVTDEETGELVPSCTNLAGEDPFAGPPRVATTVARVFDTSRMTADKSYHQPTMRNQLCQGRVDSLAADLSFTAPVETRELAFPDLMAVTNELVRITWEGLVSLDGSQNTIDGPATRAGYVEPAGANLSLIDNGGPFCRTGVEPYDIVELEGCDPTRGDSECSLGETCFVHPDTGAQVGSGTCVPDGREIELAETCRDFMISERRYTITETNAGDLTAVPRRYALELTPLEGCESAAQCEDLHHVSVDLGNPEHPVELRNATCNEQQGLIECPLGYVCSGTQCVVESFNWVCEEDPSRQPGKSWCQISCQSEDDCAEGSVCSADGYCVLGPVPTAECVTGLQRYRLRVGEAYALVGELTGFQHNRVYDEGTGACVDSPTPDPLKVGRVPLTAPPCTGDGMTDVTPNPCSITVSQTDIVPDVVFEGGACVLVDPQNNPSGQKFVTRDVPAIRVQTAGMRFHVASVGTTGDANCIGDMAGGFPPFPAVHAGTQIRFQLTGGVVPIGINPAPGIRYPVRLAASPDGTTWVLDQGDRSASTQGQIFRFFTNSPGALFEPQSINVGR